ncbi:sigma-70 family RNA polymerase sigma factor [Maribellus comscasis]|uniref:Sigma-70 family RNA polymerase sigma factor n=1 Tax=Maribellus comscasis TaxID=2681766 RepID=A0A6I6K2W0_9BACT|nr:sigma-70 family RNA polymerase sigma factor [Maribellus comscasis]QGY44254.1 sigma-70 family RNA polymerase sigma factor [Maribellus comscasis]
MNLHSENNDNRLISLLQEGDKKAFRLLFEKYSSRLYQFAIKYLRDKEDTEDLLNEVFLKIWENRHSLKTNTVFQSYLFTIAYNNIRQRFLKKSREEKYIRIFAEEYIFDSANKEEQFDYLLFLKKLDEIIDLLPPRRKEIFILSFKKELKNKVIASQLELSEQFVKNQLSLARKFIVKKMQEDKNLAGILFFFLFSSQGKA